MNAKDNRETNDPSIVIEDLSAQHAQVIKGGKFETYTKIVMEDCLISSWQ